MNQRQKNTTASSERGYIRFGVLRPLGIIFALLLVVFDVGNCYDEKDVIETAGDIILGGLFPIHKKSVETENKCGTFNEIPGYQYMEAMLFAVDKINKDPDLLPNITLGTRIHDTCQSTTIAADRAKDFIKMTLSKTTKGQLAGVVGALSSGVSATVANFLRVFEIPQISYASTSVTLSNKDIYSYFLRTVAPDSFQARAMVDIVRRFGWSYVATVHSAGTYGTKGMEIFWKDAEENELCIDLKLKLSAFPSKSEYKDVVERLVTRSTESNVSVVVLFCTQTDARNLLEAAMVTQGARRFTWIGSDGWSNRFDVTATSDDVAEGALTVMMRRGGVREYEDYFVNLNLTNYPRKNKRFFQHFWEGRFNCNIPRTTPSHQMKYNSTCQGNEDLANVSIEFSPVRVVINAVYAFAHALHSLQKELCPNQVGICTAMQHFQRSHLLDYLKNVTFRDSSLNTTVEFDRNGEVNAMYEIMNVQKENRYVSVATWDGELVKDDEITGKLKIEERKIIWTQGSSDVPESFCSRDCELGAIRVPMLAFDFECCWRCSPCESLQIIVNNSCTWGPVGRVPNANRTGWVKRKVLHPKWSDGASLVLLVISVISLVLTLAACIVYMVHKNNRIVKASGRELCYVMLAGIAMCFITPFLFLTKPNNPLCYARNLITGLALAMCYAPLFMKINRIYRIFTSARSSVARPAFVSPHMQLLVTFALVSIQLMFTTLWFIAKPVQATEKFYTDSEELVLECNVDQLSFSVNLCYVIVLMVLCTAYAFKTRNFPKNFNESKYIGITMYITCAVWMVFFPFFLNTSYSFTHVYLISGACVTIGLITLTGLFAQKIYIVYYVREIRNEDLVMTSIQKREVGQGSRRVPDVDGDEN